MHTSTGMWRTGLLVATLAVLACTPRPPSPTLSEPTPDRYGTSAVGDHFVVHLTQDTSSVMPANGQVVTIRRAPFSFVFESRALDGYLVNISKSRQSLEKLLGGHAREEIDGLTGGSGIAESKLNPDKKAFVAQKSSNYWYYDSDQESRFDTHTRVGEVHVLTREIENLYDHATATSFPVPAFGAESLFICIVTSRLDSLTREWVEYQRHGFTLAFGTAVGMSGEEVVIPARSPAPVVPADTTGQSDTDSSQEPNAFALDIPEIPPEGECFVLTGVNTSGDTVYSESVCPEQLTVTNSGYRADFANLDTKALYDMAVLFPNGRSYYLFKRKALRELY